MGEAYFTDELFRFLKQLKRNNKREWFQSNKARYEAVVRDPCLRFIAALAGPLQRVSPWLVADPHPTRGSLFRIYRDTRFSPDKRPYKTHVGMSFPHRGTKQRVHLPGFYLHLEPEGCFAAAGCWHPDNPTLIRIRSAMVARPEAWTKAVRGLELEGDALSRPPRGYPCDHPLVADLKRKDFIASVELSQAQVCGPRFMAEFLTASRKLSPLVGFLSQALGLPYEAGEARGSGRSLPLESLAARTGLGLTGQHSCGEKEGRPDVQPACLGFRVHSGWSALVAVARTTGSWQVLERRRISVVDGKIAGHTQPYHFAREQPLPEAKKHIARCAAASLRMARETIEEVVGRLSREHRVAGAVVLLASGRPLPELEKILVSHPLIHTAEGEFFRRAFSEACEALGIPVTRIRERDLAERAQTVFRKSAASLPRELAAAAKRLGPPWGQDQKAAALAAAVALGEAGR